MRYSTVITAYCPSVAGTVCHNHGRVMCPRPRSFLAGPPAVSSQAGHLLTTHDYYSRRRHTPLQDHSGILERRCAAQRGGVVWRCCFCLRQVRRLRRIILGMSAYLCSIRQRQATLDVDVWDPCGTRQYSMEGSHGLGRRDQRSLRGMAKKGAKPWQGLVYPEYRLALNGSVRQDRVVDAEGLGLRPQGPQANCPRPPKLDLKDLKVELGWPGWEAQPWRWWPKTPQGPPPLVA